MAAHAVHVWRQAGSWQACDSGARWQYSVPPVARYSLPATPAAVVTTCDLKVLLIMLLLPPHTHTHTNTHTHTLHTHTHTLTLSPRFIIGLPLFQKNAVEMSRQMIKDAKKYLGSSVIGYELGNEVREDVLCATGFWCAVWRDVPPASWTGFPACCCLYHLYSHIQFPLTLSCTVSLIQHAHSLSLSHSHLK